MAATLEESAISYEELADIELEFEHVETEIIRQQVALTDPLYTRRSKTVAQIPNFWPLVLEQAPPDIDQYIQPSDSALLLSHLTSLSVTRFESSVEPRSVAISFSFSPNEHFTDTTIEKKFWFRRSKDNWSGLVSEPVKINWKTKEKDLTGGLLDLVLAAWEAEKKSGTSKGGLSSVQKVLKKKIESTGMGGSSFFAWFGFIGRHISAEESIEANKLVAANLKAKKNGTAEEAPAAEEETADGGEDDDDESLEIFPDGDDLAVAFSEDLWPGAIRYFTQAQEQDALSDIDFESDEDELDDAAAISEAESEEDESGPPAKKQKSS